jgi:hypothetical protein
MTIVHSWYFIGALVIVAGYAMTALVAPAYAHCVTTMGPCIDRTAVAVETVTPYLVLAGVLSGAMLVFWRFVR